MDHLLVIIPRTLLGLMFLSAGLDGLSYVLRGKLLFAPPLSEAGARFIETLKNAKLLWAVKSLVDLIASLMLLANIHAPLAVLALLPAAVVIMAFQLSINRLPPVSYVLSIVLAVLFGALLLQYSSFYAPLIAAQDGFGPLSSARGA